MSSTYRTEPQAPAIYLGDDARAYSHHGTAESVVGPDYIGVELYGVDADHNHVRVGALTMTPAAAMALRHELEEALANRYLATGQVSA